MSSSSRRKNHFKIVLLGEGCVGKTSLVLRYCEDKFNDKHLTTLQASFLNRRLNIDGERVILAIWDTAGQERFHALGPIYYRDSHGAVLVYDITDEDSFEKVKNWVKELKKMLGDNIAITIVGNKIDLEKDRVVAVEVAEQYAKTVGAVHCHTSAKINKGIEELFLELSKRMMVKQAAEAADDDAAPGGRGDSQRRSKNVIIVDDQDQPGRSGGCCNT